MLQILISTILATMVPLGGPPVHGKVMGEVARAPGLAAPADGGVLSAGGHGGAVRATGPMALGGGAVSRLPQLSFGPPRSGEGTDTFGSQKITVRLADTWADR